MAVRMGQYFGLNQAVAGSFPDRLGPQETWKTAQDAVSHSAHTHHRLLRKEKNDGDSTNVTKPSTESDHGVDFDLRMTGYCALIRFL